MKSIVCIAFLLFSANAVGAQTPAKPTEFDINTAEPCFVQPSAKMTIERPCFV